MKKLKTTGIAIILILFFVNINAKAQSNVFKLNIFSPIVSTINVSFEHALGDSKSLQLGVAYTGASIADTKLSGLQLTPEFRLYLSETSAPEGVFVAPYLRYAGLSLSEDNIGSEGTATTIGGGLTIGKQWIFKSIVAFEAFIGPSYGSTSFKVDVGSEDDFDLGSFDGFGLRFGVNLGVAF